jgi:nicotinate-nucleotide adenylyltransferase
VIFTVHLYYNNNVRIGVLPGTFNPPTHAHLALAEAALPHVDRVVFVLPEVLPHKDYSGVSFEDRLALLRAVATPPFEVAVTKGGLFIDIARSFDQQHQPVFLCGRDAAERIVNWDYGDPAAFLRMLDEFEMLVASRNGDYEPPAHMAHRIRPLALSADCNDISATEVRNRIRAGRPWEHLVPHAIHNRVKQLYGPTASRTSPTPPQSRHSPHPPDE